MAFFSKRFKPGEVDDIAQGIIDRIQDNFKLSNLEYGGKRPTFTYKLDGDVIQISPTSSDGQYKGVFKINDDDIAPFVNKHYIEDLFDYFSDKKQNGDNGDEKKRDIRSRYDKYSTKYDEESSLDA